MEALKRIFVTRAQYWMLHHGLEFRDQDGEAYAEFETLQDLFDYAIGLGPTRAMRKNDKGNDASTG